jgi:TolB protein
MKSFAQLFLCMFIVLCGGLFSSQAVAQSQSSEYELELLKKTQIKVDIAVPRFVKIENPGAKDSIAEKARSILMDDLIFSELFREVSSTRFATIEQGGEDPTRIDYQTWRNIGAQWVLKSQYQLEPEEDSITLIFRLFDVANGKFVIGKRYRAKQKFLRKIIHKFADEAVYRLTGKKGIASTKIAFVGRIRQKGEIVKEIFTADIDGRNVRKLTQDGSVLLKPAWSPEGAKVAFSSYSKKNPNLYMIDTKSKKKSLMLNFSGLNAAPSWSPNGNEIALVLSKDQNSEIYSFTKNRKLRRLTRHYSIDTSPSWSPDGGKIVFASDRSGSGFPQIYIMNSRDGDQDAVTRISFNSSHNDNPAWSPDGTKIAYTSKVGQHFQIKIYFLKDRKTVIFTNGNVDREEPSWSPDGSFLIFQETRNNRSHLAFKRVGGSKIHRFIPKKGEGLMIDSIGEFHPAWSPYLN